MEINVQSGCISKTGELLCGIDVEGIERIEALAAASGALVAEGSISCSRGPRRFTRHGLGVNACRAVVDLPIVTDSDLAQAAIDALPGSNLQPVRE